MLLDNLNLKVPQGVSQKAASSGATSNAVISDTLCPWITFILKLLAKGIWHHSLKRHGHSSKVPEDHGFTLHFKFYLLWGFISVVVQTQKEKKTHFVTHALKYVSQCY